MERPSGEVVAAASEQAARMARTSLVIAGCSLLAVLAVLGSASRLLGPAAPRLVVPMCGALVVPAIYAVSWYRAAAARRRIESGPHRWVRAAGWCRPNDGCNYALFFSNDGDLPDAVIRLPLRREVKGSVDAWLAGSSVPSALGAVALFDESGLLATGRTLDLEAGRVRWQRRQVEPGPRVQRPPKDWLPPGGS